MASKDRDRIRQIRENANALREQEEARKRRSRMFAQLGIVAGALVVIAAIVLLVVMGPRWFSNQQQPAAASGMIEVPTSTGETVEVPISVSADGVVVGDPEAPTTMNYYYDFSCSHCQAYHTAVGEDLKQIIGDGSTVVTFNMMQIVDQYGTLAAASTMSAIQAQPELYFTIMDGIFAVAPQTQVGWNYSQYRELLESLGVTDATALENIEDGVFTSWVGDSTRSALSGGVTGTPAMRINGELVESLPATGDELRALVGDDVADPEPETTPAEDVGTSTATEQPAE